MPPEHGFIQLDMQRGESQMDSPYPGTAVVIATLEYQECLNAFYSANVAYQQQGPDGPAIFGGKEEGGEGWADRLCKQGTVRGMAECEIESIEQSIDVVNQLTVTYLIKEPNIEGKRLLFGPIPTEETAACENGELPTVRVGGSGAITGENGNGDRLWDTESFSPPEAVTGQGAPIRIGAAKD